METWIGDLPVVVLEGAPHERGLQHGRVLGEKIHAYLAKVRELFTLRQVAWTAVLETAESYQTVLRRECPAACLELEGIAKGCEVRLGEIVALNAPHELNAMAALRAEGCTTIVALPSATASGHTLIGKNYDEPYQRLKTDALFAVHPDTGPRFATLASVGTLARDGFNAAGLVLLGNGLHGPGDGQVPGVPFPILRRSLLAQRSLADLQQALESSPRSHACNYTVASVHGEARALEASVERVYPVAPSDGLLVHTNHFLSSEAEGSDRAGGDGGRHSRFRLARVRSLLAPKIGRLGLEEICGALADHAQHPNSVCSHQREGGTLSSYWMDLQEGIFHLTNGPPCSTRAFTVSLKELGVWCCKDAKSD